MYQIYKCKHNTTNTLEHSLGKDKGIFGAAQRLIYCWPQLKTEIDEDMYMIYLGYASYII